MAELLTRVFALYNAILEPFGSPDFGPKLATALLALAVMVFLCFLCFVLPQAYQLRAALVSIKGKSKSRTEHEKRLEFQKHYEAIDDALLSNRVTSNVWQEFRKTLIFRGSGENTIILASARPANFFNARSLLVQYDFVRSLPNYFVGLGLLGTFIGLIAALTFSTKSLTAAVDQQAIKDALNQLLTTAAAKFYISAAGLVASLALSLLIRLTLKQLHAQVHRINDALQERLLLVSEQFITEKQLTVQQDSLTELRLFNTNIAMRIGDAVRNAVEVSNESLTKKLSEIADSFSRLIEASGTGAGTAVAEAMKGAFDTSLREAGDAIGGVAAELKELPARLSDAANSIQKVGHAAAEQQQQLASQIQEAIGSMLADAGNKIAENIDGGTKNLVQGLSETSANFGASAGRIEDILEKLGGSWDHYIETLSKLSAQNQGVSSDLQSLSSQIVVAAENVSRASLSVDNNLSRLIEGMDNVNRLLSESTRSAQHSQTVVRDTVDALQKQMSVHMDRFNNVDEALARVFNSISSHLELQSKQMGEQLATMDQALARAVNQFEQLIDDLTHVTRNEVRLK
jgi:hypothetical protein